MFVKVTYFSILYCLCFVEYMSEDMVYNQGMEDTDPYPQGGESLMISDYGGDQWKEFEEDYNKERGKVHDTGWENTQNRRRSCKIWRW